MVAASMGHPWGATEVEGEAALRVVDQSVVVAGEKGATVAASTVADIPNTTD